MARLCFLHGALGASVQFQPLVAAVNSDFDPCTLDFSGHGKRATEQNTDFGIARFGQDVLDWMEQENESRLDFFGYSMGGYVALWLAAHYPEKVGKVMTLATKFNWTPEAAEKESRMLNPDKMEEKVPAFASQLAALHGPETWKSVALHTARMMHQLGANPLVNQAELSRVQAPVQLMVGDRDAMVSLEETIQAYRHLPNARLAVLPDTRHPLEKAPLERLATEIRHFFS